MSKEAFDYIIVGAGSAGCVLAARLSQSERHRVLLLEAGPRDTQFWVHVPIGYSKVFTDPRVNWMFESEPEPELENRRMYQPRGKVLGGTSSINGMVYIRGNRWDYDNWANMGCTGWGWDDVAPYFARAEGDDGLRISETKGRHELVEAALKAGQSAGLAYNGDFNGPTQDGIGPYRYNTFKGRRWSSAKAYLDPARNRPNLWIVTEADVANIILREGRAVGVRFEREGVEHEAYAAGEVILSAGVFGSPRILEHSGIGDASRLRDLGIEPKIDLPAVGANLQDHFFTQLMFRCTKPITINDFAKSKIRMALEGLRYVLTRTGVLAATHLYIGGFTRTRPDLPKPDLQFNMTNWSVAERTAAGARPHPFSGFSLSPIHLFPDARGSSIITSADRSVQSSIRFNYLQTDYDKEAMLFGVRLMRRIASQAALQPYIAEEIQPGPDTDSDEDIIAFLRNKAVSNLHSVGTCRMGPDPKTCVVDSNLKLHGLAGLRVVDGSIMPRIVGGNTHGATVMIAEKASDLILADVP